MDVILWYDTKRINRYTGKPNKYTIYKGLVINVYKRLYGWSYTCKFKTRRKRWLQEAADTNQYHYYMGEAQLNAILDAEDLLKIIGHILVPQPPPDFPGGEPTEPPPSSVPKFKRRI
jgi:hypothetical protein